MNSSVSSAHARDHSRLARALHIDLPEVWLRFLLAIGGLVAAFAAALFSTVSRESGNLWATVVLASIALLLAVIVGLTTVPYLARRVAAARIRDAFDYQVTRFGIIFLLIIFVIGVAALNTGNNLLYIIVASMLAAILVSGVASAITLRGMQLDVDLPEHVFAGESVLGRLTLHNLGRWLPTFSVSVVSLEKPKPNRAWRWSPTTFVFPRKHPWIRLPDRKFGRGPLTVPAPEIFQGSVYFPYIPARQQIRADLELQCPHRGRYQQDEFGLSTRFPFAFLSKTRRVSLPREIIAYPSVEPPDELFEVLPMITGEFEMFARGRGSDLYRIREYMPEDSARYVDWKATAKSGSLKVREFSREDERKLRIVFDNPSRGQVEEGAYERTIALIASLAWHFSHENTDLSYVAPGFAGPQEIYSFLRYLALIEPGAGSSILERLSISDDYNLIVTARSKGTIPTALWSCSYFLFLDTPHHSSGLRV